MVVFVTGAMRGLGFSLVKVLAQAGHTVYAGVLDPQKAEDLHALAAQEKAVHVLALDVREECQAAQAAADIRHAEGRLDALINNAGVIGGLGVAADALVIEDAQQEMDVNLWGAVRCVKHALPLLREAQAPCIINISSEAASLSGTPGPPYAYTLSKAALNMFTRILHGQYAQEGLRVWAVHPGRMTTGMGKPHFTLSPDETAAGVLAILEGRQPIDARYQFINYKGEEMPL